MTEPIESRLEYEAQFQDEVMRRSMQGERGVRGRFYFINLQAYKRYNSLLEGLSGRRVVVVGCSDGGVTPLARQQVYVEGIDISTVSIERLRAAIVKEGLTRYATAEIMNAEALTYPAASLDAVACTGVLHHLDTDKALRSWAGCLKDDGRVFLFEPLALHPLAALFRLLTPAMRTPDEHPLRGRDFELMRRHFERVDMEYFGLTTVLCAGIAVIPGARTLAHKLLPGLEALDRWLFRYVPFLRRFAWLVVGTLQYPRHPPA